MQIEYLLSDEPDADIQVVVDTNSSVDQIDYGM